MEMVGKQFSHLWNCLCNPVLLLVQLCLTACTILSYCLCNPVLLLVQPCLTACTILSYFCATLSYFLCNPVLLLVQPCITACTTLFYCLWKWLARSSPIYGNGFRSCTSENQRLHKELSNSENRVTYRLR